MHHCRERRKKEKKKERTNDKLMNRRNCNIVTLLINEPKMLNVALKYTYFLYSYIVILVCCS
jgi:hypothetical protein